MWLFEYHNAPALIWPSGFWETPDIQYVHWLNDSYWHWAACWDQVWHTWVEIHFDIMPLSYTHFDKSSCLPCYCSGQYRPQLDCKIETAHPPFWWQRVYYSMTTFSIIQLHSEKLPFRHGLLSNVKLFINTDYFVVPLHGSVFKIIGFQIIVYPLLTCHYIVRGKEYCYESLHYFSTQHFITFFYR